MAQAVLINVFEVPEGRDDEFLAGWEEGKRFMERQPGCVSTALHRSLDPQARFRYINLAVWESADDSRCRAEPPRLRGLSRARPLRPLPLRLHGDRVVTRPGRLAASREGEMACPGNVALGAPPRRLGVAPTPAMVGGTP